MYVCMFCVQISEVCVNDFLIGDCSSECREVRLSSWADLGEFFGRQNLTNHNLIYMKRL